jgi:hypothetical protein
MRLQLHFSLKLKHQHVKHHLLGTLHPSDLFVRFQSRRIRVRVAMNPLPDDCPYHTLLIVVVVKPPHFQAHNQVAIDSRLYHPRAHHHMQSSSRLLQYFLNRTKIDKKLFLREDLKT